MKKRAVEIVAMILLGIGLFMVVGSIGNIEFADLTHTVGYTAAQFWTRCIIGIILAFAGVAIGNKVTR